MKILSLSDTIIPFIYGPQVRTRFQDVGLIISCGDLPYYYLEYVFNALDVPLYFVRGNHDRLIEYSTAGQRIYPQGGIDLHGRIRRQNDLILAGVEGSLRYKNGSFQYSQSEMYAHILSLIPGLVRNRIRYGRYLDVFVAHAPPVGIHDKEDLPHQGIQAFRWLIKVFRPDYFFHGHIHIMRPDSQVETVIGKTRVINTFGYRETLVDSHP